MCRYTTLWNVIDLKATTEKDEFYNKHILRNQQQETIYVFIVSVII